MRAFDELGPALLADHAGVPAGGAVFEPALPTPPLRVHGRDPAEPEGQESARWISETESRLLAMLDGRASGRELSARIGLEEAKILSGSSGWSASAWRVTGAAGGQAVGPRGHAGRVRRPVCRAGPSRVDRPGPGRVAPGRARSCQAAGRGGGADPPAGAAGGRGGPVPAAAPGPPRAVAPRLQLAARLLAAGLFGALVVLATWRPLAVPLPFPWQEAERGQIEKARRTALVLAMDRVARAHFLLEAVPERARQLPRSRAPRQDPARPVRLPLGVPAGPGRLLADPARSGRSAGRSGGQQGDPGDFLLDPEFLAFDEATKVAPSSSSTDRGWRPRGFGPSWNISAPILVR